jgi:hypothetical protein
MSKLETVVRPFAIEPFTARSLPPVQGPGAPKPNIVTIWGDTSSLKAKSIGVHDLSSGKNWTEHSRVTHNKRVTNPNDPTSFIDLKITDKMHLKDENGVDHFLNFNNP